MKHCRDRFIIVSIFIPKIRMSLVLFFFFQAEDGIRDVAVTGVQTCALPIYHATMEGLSATASTITSAALIMILVFGTFAFTRVLAVQLIGFGLAAAVLLDATLIRMVLVPAIMHIAGRWNWWPGVRAPRLEAGNSD